MRHPLYPYYGNTSSNTFSRMFYYVHINLLIDLKIHYDEFQSRELTECDR